MEYVPGQPITDYCDRHRLTMKERLELVFRSADGVEHAIRKPYPSRSEAVERAGRDAERQGGPEIIDFGLAKAMAQRLTDKTMFTELGVLLGTPDT